MLLIGAKTLLTPILITLIVSRFKLDPVVSNGESVDLSLVGFIIGTLPTSPAVCQTGSGILPSPPSLLPKRCRFLTRSNPSILFQLFIYALDFGILLTEVTQVVVIGTLISAPLMSVTAQLASLTLDGISEAAGLFHVGQKRG